MNTQRMWLQAIVLFVSMMTLGPATGNAEPSVDPDRLGDRIENRLDRQGDRIERRLDRKAAVAREAEKDVLSNKLDRKGDRIDNRLDRRGNRLNRKLDNKQNSQ